MDRLQATRKLCTRGRASVHIRTVSLRGSPPGFANSCAKKRARISGPSVAERRRFKCPASGPLCRIPQDGRVYTLGINREHLLKRSSNAVPELAAILSKSRIYFRVSSMLFGVSGVLALLCPAITLPQV